MEFTHPEPIRQRMGFALFGTATIDLDALAAALVDEYGVGVARGTGPDDAGSFLVSDGATAVMVSAVPEPLPGDEATQAAHPMWWEDPAPVADHRSHVVIATVPGEGAPSHEELLASATLFSAVAVLVLELPDAVGLYYGNGGTTFPAEIYTRYVRSSLAAGELPADVWVTVWPSRDNAGHTGGSTLGLGTFGHADLVVEGSEHEASEVFFLLNNVASHLVRTGEQLMPGESLSFEDAVERAVSVHDNQWGTPMLRIDF